MLAYRVWVVMRDRDRLVLRSPLFAAYWRTPEVTADRTPGVDDEHGIYAYAPDARPSTSPLILKALPRGRVLVYGAVDAYGAIVEHADGVIRAQHAKILALRVLPGPAPCGQVWVLDNTAECPGLPCSLVYCDCHKYGDEHSISRLYRQHFDVDHVEAELLARYGVPRLPDTVGLPQ